MIVPRTKSIFAALAGALSIVAAVAGAAEPEAITITVAAGARQSFGGFGTSLGNWRGEYQKLAPEERAQLSDLLWKDLKFTTLRLWLNIHEYAPTPGARDLSVFRRCYVDSGIIADARQRGVTTLLLAPDGLADYMKEPKPGGGRGIKDSEVAGYAVVIADCIQQLGTEAGVRIDATGIQNEPGDSDRFTPGQMAEVIKHLRAELDRRGLARTGIVAPEQSNCDASFYAWIDAVKQDAAAWHALTAVSSHSYNMAATAEAARRLAAPDGANLKEYWMTEASDNGPEEPGDQRRAASLAARFLNDMNHRVTHWIHFLGFEQADPKDNATRIIAYTAPPLRPVLFQKYFAYRQLAAAFDTGARFRANHSSLEGDMTWTYGQKPRVTAAAARNPDGSWSLGLVNYTAADFLGVQGWGDAAWNRTQGGHTPAQSFTVTIRLEELKDTPELPCGVHRTGGAAPFVEDEIVTLRQGETQLTIAPLEIVTLRTPPPPAAR